MSIQDDIQQAYRNDQAATCVLLAEQWLRDNPDDLWVIFKYASMLYQMTRYAEAIRVLEDAIEQFPDHRWGLFNTLGGLHRYRGDFPEAEKWFQRAIDEDPDEATSYIFLGAVQALQGKLQEAEQTHRLATQCQEGCIDEAFHNLGLVLRGQGRLPEAKACFEKAIEIFSEYADAIEALQDVTTAINLQASSVHDQLSEGE